MEQYVPQVSDADIDRIVIGTVEVREKPRVVLACLKNAKGDLEKLEARLADAPGYWREIISEKVCPRRRKTR